MIPAALDPGSAHCGLAVGYPDIAAHQIEVNGNTWATSVAIVDWLVSVGATSLVIEWSPAWMSGEKIADMARAKHRDRQQPIVHNVARMCRERGIDAASEETIAASKGPGLIGVSTWRSAIGARSVKDPVTGRFSSKDSAVRDALIRWMGAEATRALGPGDHRRDAAGLLLASILAPPVEERGAPGTDKRHRPGNRHRGRQTLTPEQAERHRISARDSARRKAKAKRAAIDPATLLPARLRVALTDGPLQYAALAVALGYSHGGCTAAIRPYLAPGGRDGVELARVRLPGEGWARYALASPKSPLDGCPPVG